ncbi:hypothetical protein [Mesorhizobium sp. B2-1-3A]|uniref:hypothetical protein n=1 Tax=Mesorhizobium sp. B2-1-3A TaxID=2589971 RepID=UPI001FEE989B|nr:hypothetical protein [Mesorhizobium sp. B2-1-3A]
MIGLRFLLLDRDSSLPQGIVDTVDRLMPFIQPEARETVKSQIPGLTHEYKIEGPGSGAEQDRPA